MKMTRTSPALNWLNPYLPMEAIDGAVAERIRFGLFKRCSDA